MIFPDGSTVNLKGMLGGDGQGKSGFEDDVDNHYIRTFGSAILISMLGVGAQMSQPQNSGALNTAPASAQVTGAVASSLNNTGDRLLNKNLNIQPTLEIRPGYTFNVLVNRTIILPPYQ
jgi:type IV secretion system protein VirB10